MLYRERLWPSSWMWLLVLALAGTLGIAYGAAYGALVGLATFVPVTALALGLLVLASPVVSLSPDRLRAGRADIPCSVLARCAELDAEGMKRALRSAEPTLFMLVRPWSVTHGVLIEVVDPLDPHTSWLVSSRRPAAFVDALGQAGVPRTMPGSDHPHQA